MKNQGRYPAEGVVLPVQIRLAEASPQDVVLLGEEATTAAKLEPS